MFHGEHTDQITDRNFLLRGMINYGVFLNYPDVCGVSLRNHPSVPFCIV